MVFSPFSNTPGHLNSFFYVFAIINTVYKTRSIVLVVVVLGFISKVKLFDQRILTHVVKLMSNNTETTFLCPVSFDGGLPDAPQHCYPFGGNT